MKRAILKNNIERTKELARNLKEDPVNGLGFLIPVVIGLIALGSGIVTYIMYIFKGGYTAQINAVKKYGWFGEYSKKFTTGTTGMISSGIIGKILFILMGVEFILMMINYFQCNKKGKRITMIVDLSFLAVQIPFIINTFVGSMGVVVIVWISKLFGVTSVNLQTFAYAYGVILTATVILFMILVLTTEECRWMLKYTLLAFMFAKILIPVVFLILQNIISVFTTIVALLVTTVVFIFVGICIWTGGNGGSTEPSSSSVSTKSYGISSESRKSSTNKLQKKKEEKRKMKSNKNSAYISNLNEFAGIKLFKVHGTFGDYIELDNCVVNRKICSLEALEKGKFHIYDEKTGREVKSIEIPWRKQ